MAFTKTPTLLSLDEWAVIFGISPWRFNQLYADQHSLPGYEQGCAVWFQEAWQGDGRLAREDVAEAIRQAEDMLFRYVGYRAAWDFIINQEIAPKRHYDRLVADIVERCQLQLPEGYFVAGGIEAYTLLDDDVTVTTDDLDGDGFDEIWYVTVGAGGVTSPWEIGAYHTDANRNGEPVSQNWRMRPVRVDLDIAADTVTITGARWQLVTPDLLLVPHAQPLNIQVATTFVDEVDVYRRYLDTAHQGTAYWRREGCTSGCGASAAASLCAVNERLGLVDAYATCPCCASERPLRCKLHYLAGMTPTTNGDIDGRAWKEAIAYLAAALLGDRKCCDCDEGNTKLRYMRVDRAAFSGAGDRRLLTLREASAGFGTVQGALEAWRFVNLPGVRLGAVGVAF